MARASVVSRLSGLRRRTPLRVKLVAALLLLVALALLGSGIAATATLRSYLLGRVDSQLRQAERPIAEHSTGGTTRTPDGGGDDGADGGGRNRGPSDYVVAVADSSGTIVYGPTNDLVDTTLALPALPRRTAARTGADGTTTFTVHAVGGDGLWRVLAAPVTLDDGSAGTLLIAQSLDDVQNTADRLVLLLLVIGAAAVVVLGVVGYVVVRTSLRPLRDVEQAAATIAAGDLSHRVPDGDPRTEVGRLAAALNGMLAEIETAFAERAASEEAARRSEEQLRLSEAAARRSEERMRRFVADAGHELRTPLTSVRGFAELYRQGAASTDEDVRRLMRRIEDEARRMGLLVEDLLMLARLDQQRPLERQPVDLLALAGDAVHDAGAVAPDRPIRLEVGPTDPPPIVTGDDARLRQVLANLVGNALQHTPPGTPVTVRLETRSAPGGDVVVLTVADEGPGMSAEDAARVFERFYRADASRNRADGGTGLGLAIVASLVAAHGGSVDVESAPGAGARFRVVLPLAGVPAAAS